MSLINWFLVPFLLTLPVVVCWFQRQATPEKAPERRKLALWTGAALGLMLLLAGIDALGGFAWWGELPRMTTWGKRPAELAWIPTFWLWMLAARILGHTQAAAPGPEHGTAGPTHAGHPAGGQRAASLSSRRTASPLPHWMWALLWLPWSGALAWLVIAWNDAPERERLVALLILACQVPGLVVAMFTPRLVLREPEPLDPAGAQDLTPLYARYRQRRLVGFYVLTAVISLSFCGMAVSMVQAAFDDRTLGLVGGIGGSLIGIAGGAFGAWQGMERMKISRQLESACSSES